MRRPRHQWFASHESARRVEVSSRDELIQRIHDLGVDLASLARIEQSVSEDLSRVELFSLEVESPIKGGDGESEQERGPRRESEADRWSETGRWALFTLEIQEFGGVSPPRASQDEREAYLLALEWAAASWVIARGGDGLSARWADTHLDALTQAHSDTRGQSLLEQLNHSLDLYVNRSAHLQRGEEVARVATLAPSNLEIVESLGITSRLIACEDSSDLSSDVFSDVVRLGPDLNPDLEVLESLKPDLCVSSLSVPGMERVITGLAQRGLSQLVLAPRSFFDVCAEIERVATRLGVPEEGTRVTRSLKDEHAQLLRSRPSPLARVYLEWWPKPMFTPGARCFSNELIELAGGVNIFKDRLGSSVEVTPQELIEAQPEVCFLSWCGAPLDKVNPENLRGRSGLESLNERARHHVVPIDEAYTGRPGPRMLEASRQMARVIRALNESR